MNRQDDKVRRIVVGVDGFLIHSLSDAKRLARQLPDARLIRIRTFAELWVTLPV